MRALLVLAALCMGTAAHAQTVSYPQTVTPAMIPQAGTGSPSGPVDTNTGAAGNVPQYAPFNHVHPSKARKDRVLVPASGTYDVTFTQAFTEQPLCSVTAETTLGDTATVNAQIDGRPTTTGMRIRITRTQQSVVALIGLTILSVPTQIATYAHYICLEP